MSNDIVERLQFFAPYVTRPQTAKMMTEAADTIASLRKQLEDAREALRFYANLPCNLEFGVVNECPYDDGATAREALKGKS